jgi:hypothetical protein
MLERNTAEDDVDYHKPLSRDGRAFCKQLASIFKQFAEGFLGWVCYFPVAVAACVASAQGSAGARRWVRYEWRDVVSRLHDRSEMQWRDSGVARFLTLGHLCSFTTMEIRVEQGSE